MASSPTFFQSLRIAVNRWSHRTHLLILCTLLGGLLALVGSLLLPQEYGSTTRLLVIQLQSPTLDAYAASKSSERLAQTLTRVVSTDSFHNQVIVANPAVIDPYQSDPRKRRKHWDRAVEVIHIPETGILEISAYNQNRIQATLLAQTVSEVLTQHGGEYHGGGNQVVIREIDPPFTSTFPVRPPIFWNTLGGFTAGALISFFIWWWLLPTLARQTVQSATEKVFPALSASEPAAMLAAEPEQEIEEVAARVPRPEVVSLFDHLQSDDLTGQFVYGGEIFREEELDEKS
jgi:capsular polysaccharide biosynthesis protein